MTEDRHREPLAARWVGVDEAGYGPSLGPLVVGLVGLEGPRLGELWEALREELARGRRSGSGAKAPRLGDSKVLKRRGLFALLLPALAFCGAAKGRVLRSLEDLCLEPPEGLSDHPWYGDLSAALPLDAAQSAQLEQLTEALRAAAEQSGATLLPSGARLVLEGPFNRDTAAWGSKAEVEWQVIAAGLRALEGASPTPGASFVDRLGGRKRYEERLQLLHPRCALRTVEEGGDAARYLWERSGREVCFLVGGEERAPEIALASLIAKSARELAMACLNGWFVERWPGLRPTAGYPSDARRFLAELDRLGAPEELRTALVRIR